MSVTESEYRQLLRQRPIGADPGPRQEPKTRRGSLDVFLALLRAAGLPQPVLEYQFEPSRKFKADYAWPDRKVIIEQNGGVWKQGASGHSSGTGILRDYEKSNLANAAGWCYLTFTPKQLASGSCIPLLRVLLG